ncbi:AI-2E family transporter [Bacillus solimangrovi]|uniref:AI-2E family transporter n=1 Tax=Bacillus solimangrovi TaxID=1305675 RepID=A0A1E5LBB0_9BACI|nr:AI-2E family transporter [Bacillus solimangrovi]OEH91363.1 AI-2E family transporter [Bacillus solimangrovi]
MYNKRWFQSLVVSILVFLLIFFIQRTDAVFEPVFAYIGAIAFPIILSGVLYYISRPLTRFLKKRKVPQVLAIFITIIILLCSMFFVVRFIAPIAQDQITKLLNNVPKMVNSAEDIFYYWKESQEIFPEQLNDVIDDASKMAIEHIEEFTVGITTFVITVVSQLVQFVFLLVLVPFFLFYMLKDEDKFQPFLTKFFNERKGNSLRRLLQSIDQTLSAFIQGQLTVSLCVGVMLYIGYVIIGLDYSLSLALFGIVTNVIPFLGPYLAVTPAILVALFQDPVMALYVAVIMIVAQQIEGNLISPNIMGKALNIHPITIITLILAAGSVAGFLGLLFVIPTYAVVKTIISHFYHEWLRTKAD